MADQLSDRDLVARVVGGDQTEAFSALVRRHQSIVRCFLGRLTDPATADDLAQETFVQAYRHIKRFRGDSQFSTWLIAIALNMFRQQRRRQRQQERLLAALPEPESALSEPSTADAEINRALAILDEHERVAMVLNYGHEFSHAEIAQLLAIPLGTVKSLVRRGKAKILSAFTARDDARKHAREQALRQATEPATEHPQERETGDKDHVRSR